MPTGGPLRDATGMRRATHLALAALAAVAKSEWDESQHPRDESGRFSQGAAQAHAEDDAMRAAGKSDHDRGMNHLAAVSVARGRAETSKKAENRQRLLDKAAAHRALANEALRGGRGQSAKPPAAAPPPPKPGAEAGRSGVTAPALKPGSAAHDALMHYAFTDSTGVNQAAANPQRKGQLMPAREEGDFRRADLLSAAIADSKLAADKTLYRGTKLDPSVGVGAVIGQRGFTSTTADPKIAKLFADMGQRDSDNTAILTVRAAKGQGVLNVAHASGGKAGNDEAEFLFDHRVNFRVVEDNGRGADGHRRLTVEPFIRGNAK